MFAFTVHVLIVSHMQNVGGTNQRRWYQEHTRLHHMVDGCWIDLPAWPKSIFVNTTPVYTYTYTHAHRYRYIWHAFGWCILLDFTPHFPDLECVKHQRLCQRRCFTRGLLPMFGSATYYMTFLKSLQKCGCYGDWGLQISIADGGPMFVLLDEHARLWRRSGKMDGFPFKFLLHLVFLPYHFGKLQRSTIKVAIAGVWVNSNHFPVPVLFVRSFVTLARWFSKMYPPQSYRTTPIITNHQGEGDDSPTHLTPWFSLFVSFP